MSNQEITKGLEIKKVNGFKFGNKLAYCKPTGFTLYHAKLGFLSYMESNKKYELGVKCPYIPRGGRKALQAILEGGGLNNYDNVEWIQPIQ